MGRSTNREYYPLPLHCKWTHLCVWSCSRLSPQVSDFQLSYENLWCNTRLKFQMLNFCSSRLHSFSSCQWSLHVHLVHPQSAQSGSSIVLNHVQHILNDLVRILWCECELRCNCPHFLFWSEHIMIKLVSVSL